MPLYEYQCSSCGHEFEKQLRILQMLDPEKEPCPMCSEVHVRKHIKTGVIFNADVVKPNVAFQERIREMKRTIPHNNLHD